MNNGYDQIKGYAYDNPIKSNKIEKKLHAVIEILKLNNIANLRNILIAGCGKGEEAKQIHLLLKCNVYGIDLNVESYEFKKNNSKIILKEGDISNIDFPDIKFDFIYCYHVLEHVHSPTKVMEEFYKVLNDNGKIFIGFPNRSRLIPSYFASHYHIPIKNILLYNIIDYYKRLTGKFRNEYGAHAGFTTSEFIKLAGNLFEIEILNSDWIKHVHPNYIKYFKLFDKYNFAKYLYPSNYFSLTKKIR